MVPSRVLLLVLVLPVSLPWLPRTYCSSLIFPSYHPIPAEDSSSKQFSDSVRNKPEGTRKWTDHGPLYWGWVLDRSLLACPCLFSTCPARALSSPCQSSFQLFGTLLKIESLSLLVLVFHKMSKEFWFWVRFRWPLLLFGHVSIPYVTRCDT